MTSTAATQAGLDAQAHGAVERNSGNKAAAARELGIGASTVAERVKRHLARAVQDTAVETPADEAPAVREAPAGLDADDQLAYTAECEARDCGALPGEPCISLNRDGEPVAQPWAHPRRIAAAKADAAAGQAPVELDTSLGGGEDCAHPGIECESSGDCPCACAGCSGWAEDIPGSEIPGAAEDGEDADGTAPDGSGTDAGADASADPEGRTVIELAAGPALGQDGGNAAAAEPAEAARVLVSECVKCGFAFSRPQRRQACQSAKACKDRQDKRAAAAAGK
jgi:hypothetical protein